MMNAVETLALIVALCGSDRTPNPCVHQTLDCMKRIQKVRKLDKLPAIRYCVKQQPLNPVKIRKVKWK